MVWVDSVVGGLVNVCGVVDEGGNVGGGRGALTQCSHISVTVSLRETVTVTGWLAYLAIG